MHTLELPGMVTVHYFQIQLLLILTIPIAITGKAIASSHVTLL